MIMWTFQYGNGTRQDVQPTDSRGLRRALENGCQWVCRNDGRGAFFILDAIAQEDRRESHTRTARMRASRT
jgi:hypothetical protein